MRVNIKRFLFRICKCGREAGPWVLAFFLWSSPGLSLAQPQSLEELSEYLTIDESVDGPDKPPSPTDMSPLPYLSASQVLKKANALAVSLLKWILHPVPPGTPIEKYNRSQHFGRWINDPEDETCYNTRAKVLIRDSETPVSFKEKNHCMVDQGDWREPYAGFAFTSSRDIQIDHMVPLKNAYISGAWQWDYQARCLYANFMGNRFHLISVSGRENMRKGDKAPDRYLPPNTAYRCEYVENWLKIKLIWRLNLTRSEAEAIQGAIEENNCDTRAFVFTLRELSQQRQLIHELYHHVCPAP